METFLIQLQPVRRTGLAYDLGEHTLGLPVIACAFKDRLGGLHANSVPIPTPRFDEALESLEAAISETVEQLEIMTADDLTGT